MEIAIQGHFKGIFRKKTEELEGISEIMISYDFLIRKHILSSNVMHPDQTDAGTSFSPR